MSGIAGIVHFDGKPVDPGQVDAMTAAMRHRGPDGLQHWRRGHVALGHCMLRTTPESLEETQPLANEDESLVLVMDGRVDNCEALRRELQGKGAVLRTRADAELVLRAYEVWGHRCPERIIGECTFFVWDSRRQTLFGARDAAGTRHFYYHAGRGWFGFASEIKGLLATGMVEARLNEFRLLDYLVEEFDRDDLTGTFYQDILRLPAGHAIEVSAQGVKTWCYWEPGQLPVNTFTSRQECAEAFLDQLRVAVRCRLRSNGPVGAMLSGGLDSSSIVGLVRKEFRYELAQPLKTISMVRDDRENCLDWQHIQAMLNGGWLDPTIISTATGGASGLALLDRMGEIDEPFALSHGLTYDMLYATARQQGCRVVFDGMAGDLLFYGFDRSLDAILRRAMPRRLPDVYAAYRRHNFGNPTRNILARTLAAATPPPARALWRQLRDQRRGLRDDLALLHSDIVAPWLAHRLHQLREAEAAKVADNDQTAHARSFTSGLLSFPHEVYGQRAFAHGVEPRSPLSDRRMLEFAIQMPIACKLGVPWYKQLLREATAEVLPEPLRWRCDIGNNPGWQAFERLVSDTRSTRPALWHPDYLSARLRPWVARERLANAWAAQGGATKRYQVLTMLFLAQWIDTHPALMFTHNEVPP